MLLLLHPVDRQQKIAIILGSEGMASVYHTPTITTPIQILQGGTEKLGNRNQTRHTQGRVKGDARHKR